MSNRSYFFRDNAYVKEPKAQIVLKSKIKHGGLTYDKDAKEDQKAWVSSFQHDLLIGKIYDHAHYGNCHLDRIIINPSLEFKRHWLFWSKVRPTFTLSVVISYKLDGIIAATEVITLEEFMLGIRENLNFMIKFKFMINKLNNE